jgi:PAS domain S-box-containing protein
VENRVLILAPRGRDADVIAEVLSKDGRTCFACADAAELDRELRAGAGTALIAEEALNRVEAHAPQLFQWLEQQPGWSDFPLILLAPRRTERALNHPHDLHERLGNTVVLERPLNADTLRRAVSSALRARLRQYEARRQLVERVESQERLHLALAAGRLGSWELDVENGVLRSTEAYRKIFGRTGPTLDYADVLDSIHPEDRERHATEIARCIDTVTNLNVEYRVIWPDGSTHWVETRGHPLRASSGGQGGATTRLIGVSLDVTDRHEINEKILASQMVVERMNDSLESRIAERTQELASANDRLMKEIHERAKVQAVLVQSQKMEALGQLTGGIAHDFNNLLNVIMGNAELITRLSTNERVKAMAHTVKRATERGAKLTGQLLTFSRTSNLDLKAIDLISMLHGMRDMLTLSLGTGIHFNADFDDGEVWTDADANQLELAVLNLAINARDAMPDGGVLTIRVNRRPSPDATLGTGEYAVIGVSDTGTGIPPDILSRVFDPFFTTKPVGKGTGLGLSQVYGIATQAGGTARIHSEQGVGTTVELWLPLREGSAPEVKREELVDEHAESHERILVIEDDADVRTFLVDCLAMLGYAVTEAAHGRAGLDRLNRDDPHLLMVDFAMPGMNGLEVIAEVRRTHPDLPVVLATGYADVDVSKESTDGYAVLRKPFQIGDLARTVKAALMRSHV